MTRNRLLVTTIVLTLLMGCASAFADPITLTGCPGGCQGTRIAQAAIFVPFLDQTLEIEVQGPAFADLTNCLPPTDLTWVTSSFTGSHPILGDISIVLSDLEPSTGTAVPIVPGQEFPAINTNHLFFRYSFSNLPTALLSDGPVTLTATIDAIPPIGSIYHLVDPVRLYAEGDPTRATVAIIVRDEVLFSAVPEPSTWLLVASGLIGIGRGRRRRKRAN